MPDTTFEEAARCPKCREPGLAISERKEGRGKVHVFHCDNNRCRWFETGWIVQTNEDGSVYERPKGAKQFPTPSAGQLAMGQRIVEDAVQQDLRDKRE